MMDTQSVTLSQANAYYREAAVARHKDLSELGFAWESESVKHIAKISSVGLAGTVGALAIERLESLYWLVPIAAFGLSLILVLVGMYLACASYFKTCETLNGLIDEFDTIRSNDEAQALDYAGKSLRRTPESYQWLAYLARTCGWSSAAAMLIGIIAFSGVLAMQIPSPEIAAGTNLVRDSTQYNAHQQEQVCPEPLVDQSEAELFDHSLVIKT